MSLRNSPYCDEPMETALDAAAHWIDECTDQYASREAVRELAYKLMEDREHPAWEHYAARDRPSKETADYLNKEKELDLLGFVENLLSIKAPLKPEPLDDDFEAAA